VHQKRYQKTGPIKPRLKTTLARSCLFTSFFKTGLRREVEEEDGGDCSASFFKMKKQHKKTVGRLVANTHSKRSKSKEGCREATQSVQTKWEERLDTFLI